MFLYLITYVFITNIVINEAKIKIYVTQSPIKQISGRYYTRELITDQYDAPKELTYDPNSRSLIFMYMDDEIQNSGRAFVNIVTKDSMKVKGIQKNKATAVNVDTGDVYFGSEDGLYKYNPLRNEAYNIGLYNVNVMKLVIRNNVTFLLDGNNHMIYKAIDEGTSVIKAGNWKTVMDFNVDSEGNIHFVTMCGVFCAVNGDDVVKNIDLDIVYHFIVDKQKTFGVTLNAIYDLDCKNGTARKVADIDFFPRSIVYGDYGDIFYSINDHIYWLKPINSYLVYDVYKNTIE